MKTFLLILAVIVVTNSVKQYEKDYLWNISEENQKAKKLSLLSEYVALVWGYRNFKNGYTADIYLEELAEFLLKDYDLTGKQKVKSIKVRHVLKTFQSSIFYHKQITAAHELALIRDHNGGTLPLILQREYDNQLYLIEEYTLPEGDLAIELLIRSFAPMDLILKGRKQNRFSSTIAGLQKLMLRVSVGTYVLVNELLDSEYRLPIDFKTVLNTSPEKLLRDLEEQAGKNFEKYTHSLQGEYKYSQLVNWGQTFPLLQALPGVQSNYNNQLVIPKKFADGKVPQLQVDGPIKIVLGQSPNVNNVTQIQLDGPSQASPTTRNPVTYLNTDLTVNIIANDPTSASTEKTTKPTTSTQALPQSTITSTTNLVQTTGSQKHRSEETVISVNEPTTSSGAQTTKVSSSKPSPAPESSPHPPRHKKRLHRKRKNDVRVRVHAYLGKDPILTNQQGKHAIINFNEESNGLQ